MKGSTKFWIALAITGYGWLTWYVCLIPETIDNFTGWIWTFLTSLLFWGLVVGLANYLTIVIPKFNEWLDKNL